MRSSTGVVTSGSSSKFSGSERLLAVGVLAVASAACGGATPVASVHAPSAAAPSSAESVEAARERVFGSLARTDRRLARRFGLRPEGVALLFPDNRAPAELAALFDFDARSRALSDARSRLVRDAAGQKGAEWQALERLINEELTRVDAERDLPAGTSTILRSLSFELPIRDTESANVRSEDEGLTATLDRLRATLRDGALGTMQLAEIDDGLDLFEKRTAGLPTAPGAVARLRIALGEVKAAPREVVPPWDATLARAGAFAGPLPSNLEKMIDDAHASLRKRITASLPKASGDRARVASEASATLLAAGECPDPGRRELRAPYERRSLCVLLERATRRDDPASLLALDLALDVGRWAILVHKRRADPRSTFAALGTAVTLDESDGAHVFRFALAHPVEALTLAWAAALVADDPDTKARRWLAAGVPRPGDVQPLFSAAAM